MNKDTYERGMNLTVRDLRDVLKGLPDDMDVIVTTTPEHDCNMVTGFKHIRTAGILTNKYEPKPALCLAPSEDGLDMYSLIKNQSEVTKCNILLF